MRPDPSCLKKVSVISMKVCTRTINVKNGVRKGFYEWVFLENYFALTPSNIDVTNYSESFITTVTRKTLFNRKYIVFEMDFSSFSSA